MAWSLLVFGLMLQLYIVYRLFMYRRHWTWTVALILLCAAIQLACDPESDALNRWRYNCIGGILPFGAGLLYARYMASLVYEHTLLSFIVSTIAVFLMSFTYISWYLVPLAVCSAAIQLCQDSKCNTNTIRQVQYVVNNRIGMDG